MKDILQLVFTKTRILAVKVATLVTFLAMVKTLDQVNFSYYSFQRTRYSLLKQTSLTQKLVPLLSKIRTKEPAVMVSSSELMHLLLPEIFLDGDIICSRGYGFQGRSRSSGYTGSASTMGHVDGPLFVVPFLSLSESNQLLQCSVSASSADSWKS